MAASLILSFEGPSKYVRRDRCDTRPLLEVLLAFTKLVERIGVHEALGADEAPFSVLLKGVMKGASADPKDSAIHHLIDFASRHQPLSDPAESIAAGLNAAAIAPSYLGGQSVGPPGVRQRAKSLDAAILNLPKYIEVFLRGSIDVSLSQLVHAAPQQTTVSVESFRAQILRSGGVSPRVQVKASGFDRPLTLESPTELAKQAGQALYAKAYVTAKLTRTPDDRVIFAELSQLRILDDSDPVVALDKWYEKAGKPWAKVKDIEKELGRGH
jgi:hypothetical protein